jgi:hypothetical protein
MSRSVEGALDARKNGMLAFKALNALSLGHCGRGRSTDFSETEFQISEFNDLKT